jgi:hypothetical protein
MGAAAIPVLAGSATAAAPITGALLGGLSAGAALPAAAAATGATAAALPTAAFTGAQLVPALNMAPFAMNPAGLSTIGSSAIGGGPTTGLINASIAPSFMESMGQSLKGAGQFAQQNPYLTNMAAQSAQQMMQQPQAQFAPAGQIQRGGIQDVQIASALPQAPRISLI